MGEDIVGLVGPQVVVDPRIYVLIQVLLLESLVDLSEALKDLYASIDMCVVAQLQSIELDLKCPKKGFLEHQLLEPLDSVGVFWGDGLDVLVKAGVVPDV